MLYFLGAKTNTEECINFSRGRGIIVMKFTMPVQN